MNIVLVEQIPDKTYFNRNTIQPWVENNTIFSYSGRGARRSSWGQPLITTVILHNEERFCALAILFKTKHVKGIFFRYFFATDNGIISLNWKELPRHYQLEVIRACDNEGIRKSPGKVNENDKGSLFILAPEDSPIYRQCFIDEDAQIIHSDVVGVDRLNWKNIALLSEHFGEGGQNTYIIAVDPVAPKPIGNGLKKCSYFIPLHVVAHVTAYLSPESEELKPVKKGRGIGA